MPEEEKNVTRTSIVASYVPKEWLFRELRLNPSKLIILDCRSSYEFSESHIRHAVNFSIPSIMLRRLAAGKIDLISTIKCRDLKDQIMHGYKEKIFVIYGDSEDMNNFSHDVNVMHVLIKRLQQDGCQVVCLQDGFNSFQRQYPEWCDSCSELVAPSGPNTDALLTMPLMGLRSLRISQITLKRTKEVQSASTSSTDSSESDEHYDSSACLEEDRDFPVEIVPYLYLGNAANSEDLRSLSKQKIQYILNVTPDLPNVFEKSDSFKYMQIPIADHWSQNLASFFPRAIQFIDEARSQEKGVLVHCVAGVSRSVTVTVAYLMAKLKLSLNDAFSLVRSRKSNVAPNFHFMEQLYSFEKELALLEGDGQKGEVKVGCENCCKRSTSPGSDNQCSCQTTSVGFFSPLMIGQTPDSGIEFDQWTPRTGE